MNQTFLAKFGDTLKRGEDVLLSGLSGTARTYFLKETSHKYRGKFLCLVPTEENAYDLARELRALLGEKRVFLFLARDLVFVKENASIIEVERVLTLQDLINHPRSQTVIISTPAALMYRIMSPRQMQQQSISIDIGQELPLNKLLSILIKSGYNRVDTVTRPGQLAVRGGLVDLYPSGEREPYRIEFFGDTVDTMRSFDVDSQRSLKAAKHIQVYPADELSGTENDASLLDYLPPKSLIFLDEPRDFYNVLNKQAQKYKEYLKEARREDKTIRELSLLSQENLRLSLDAHTVIYHSFFPGNIPQVGVGLYQHISQIETETFHNRLESLYPRLREWQEKGYQVTLAIKNKALRDEMAGYLSDQHLSGVKISSDSFERGFISPDLGIALVAEEDLFAKRVGKSKAPKKQAEPRLLAEDLKLGDYVVHENYGIGIYRGVTQVESNGVTREYLLLQYAGTDKLYLPVDKLDLLFRYSSSEDKHPRLSKLGGTEWERTRQRVAQSIQDMAEELLVLYATRANIKGFAFSPDTPWQRQFEDDFPYEETPDQLKAIEDTKRDMEARKPMDRIICGDVGYGKTEVALRAAFKAVMDGKQVAILVPTTVLAEQHFETFKKRFANYPANIEVLSRFRTAAQQKKTVNELSKGAVDIVIATHRLLSKDVEFHNLGLLVIDEEHRFGVAQKEKIKHLKEQVDVLSLSATPIPRSLHMGLTGLRDLSLIETAPPQRYPITTYVLEYNPEIIKEAVRAELSRGGQVFFVHNRVQDMERVKKELEELLPTVRIAVGHGRMPEEELARVMFDFAEGRYDLFLCTTIIESGLDMPNVNTIIIDMADHLGMAQLYQLRGRVGRADRVAYAYLTYRPDKVVTEIAQKRLNAIREFNELGAGMKIALRDLEIRGAGNILGAQQHGHIHAVGFDLYCRLLEQETAKLRGEVRDDPVIPQLDIDVDNYIPDDYIPDPGTKMRIYRRLLLAVEAEEIDDIRNEIRDRFGKLPPAVENFLQIAALRVKARDKEIKALRLKERELEIILSQPLQEKLQIPGIKQVNDHTLFMRMDKAVSLQRLQEILEAI
ncbi:Transcription-repair coupling factor [Syntrophomonas zehnderi OL-4]|uniref:Transcription-repair-coupling factor n=1 Tax=Syntrophomonas zehnderi OL-4 TaxID=690567 RepID=A0A0E3W2M8_9FIRM|nr:Transcription-repair coupling factor [Syntrophomonas zehnderi OL-4]